MPPQRSKAFTIIGATVILVPVAIYALWIYACSIEPDYPKNVALFNSYLPEILKGRYAGSFLSIICCVIAIVLTAGDLKSKNTPLKILALLVFVVAIALGFLNLFSLM